MPDSSLPSWSYGIMLPELILLKSNTKARVTESGLDLMRASVPFLLSKLDEVELDCCHICLTTLTY